MRNEEWRIKSLTGFVYYRESRMLFHVKEIRKDFHNHS
jgi:hypothetical protein